MIHESHLKQILKNSSLREIEYSPGTYIELLTDPTPDIEIREFQADLKNCLSHTLDGEDIYNEQKFLQVKKILDRFNGRELFGELDRKWTKKVTDVKRSVIKNLTVEEYRKEKQAFDKAATP